ncbi:hypothetical protein JZ751_028233 [Albula glossodonta]|uniref:Uncharacterized protein n=1 Tax=Albula glossodonta TaxID=121402 RepID=A0A8T2ND34_9TELE|nr:hypothetical protein JZ751_028233 [Albula glossodonta]
MRERERERAHTINLIMKKTRQKEGNEAGKWVEGRKWMSARQQKVTAGKRESEERSVPVEDEERERRLKQRMLRRGGWEVLLHRRREVKSAKTKSENEQMENI